MHTLDILFIIAAFFFVIIGIRRGLIGELFRLTALVLGFFVAFLYYPEIANLCRFKPAYLQNAVAFTLIFLIVALAVIGIGWLLKKIVHLTPLGWVDGFFGGVIGFLKTVLIFWVICLSLAVFPPGSFILRLHRSLVFQTYKKLPPGMKLSGVAGVRNLFKKNIDKDVTQKLTKTQQQAEQLKKKADSSKTTGYKHR